MARPTHKLLSAVNLKLWSGAFQTRTVTRFVAWFTRNNRYDSGDRTQPTCFRSIDTIVGMRLDQGLHRESWKLVGRPWRYQHGIW